MHKQINHKHVNLPEIMGIHIEIKNYVINKLILTEKEIIQYLFFFCYFLQSHNKLRENKF